MPTSVAQDTPAKSVSYNAVTLYGNFPLSKEFKNQAKFGGGLGFEGAYYLHSLVGFAYAFDFQMNPFNNKAILPNSFGNIDAQPWLYGKVMGGIELSYPITPIVTPEFRALAGLMIARRPQVIYRGFSRLEGQNVSISPAFAYSISGGLKFTNYDSGNAFRVGVCYLSATPTFNYGNQRKEKINIANAQLYVSFAILSRK